MKPPYKLLLVIALTFSTVTTASAYHLSPLNSRAILKGILTFYPNNGRTFRCKVTMRLKTKGVITSAALVTPGNCSALSFGELPWAVGILNANSGQFGHVDFTGGGGTCIENVAQFQDNASGMWTLPANGQCFSGTLVSTPPVTIVP